jgi:hypothetical protein
VKTPSYALVRRLPAGWTSRTASGALLAGAAAFLTPSPARGQAIKRAPTGFNIFSIEQDVEIGQRSAATIERGVRLVSSARTERFLDGVITLLAAHASGSRYRYSVKVVNSTDVNFLVLPGGPIYVTTGLLALARTEAELAGVLAHGMSHVVLRHGTARVSRAWVGTAGVGALGARLDRSPSGAGIVEAVGGFGLDAAFLGFTMADEVEADALGTELVSKAGYDPVAMAAVFGAFRREARRHAGLARLAASHPLSADREDRIRSLVAVLGHRGSSEVVGGYSAIRWVGGSYVARAPASVKASNGSVAPDPAPMTANVPVPSSQFVRYTHPDTFITVDHPSNWDTFASGFAVSFAPAGGVIERTKGTPSLVQGVVMSYYAPFEGDVDRWNNSLVKNYAPFADRSRARGILEDATDDLVRQILSASPWLTAPTGSARSEVVGGARGYSVRLSGRSPVTGEPEKVTVYTRALPDDHVVYLACVSPLRSALAFDRACARMVQSLRVNDAVTHRH